MSRIGEVGGTRMVLLRARKRKERVSHGAALLRRKREALVAQLFRIAKPAADTRVAIEDRVREALPTLIETLAMCGLPETETVSQPRELRLDIRATQVWGMTLAEITQRSPVTRTLPARGTAPGITSPLLARTATQFETLSDLLIEAAPRELLLRRLSAALTETTRHVHGLEQRVLPGLETQIARVQQALDEREREEKFRLKHLLKRRSREQ